MYAASLPRWGELWTMAEQQGAGTGLLVKIDTLVSIWWRWIMIVAVVVGVAVNYGGNRENARQQREGNAEVMKELKEIKKNQVDTALAEAKLELRVTAQEGATKKHDDRFDVVDLQIKKMNENLVIILDRTKDIRR